MDYKFEISVLIFLVYPAVTDKVLRLGVDHCCLLGLFTPFKGIEIIIYNDLVGELSGKSQSGG